ncbi:MAG: transporter substrate-binding domain-containing protein, partial [Tyzzerella sp.]|nr:transporter substrate-binding domain-containing protein [Tyzzerella sp.]
MVIGTLVGCGSSNTETTAPETEAASETVAETAGETTAAEDKVWTIATDTVFKPFEYTNENNEFVGIDVDILAAVAED